MRSFYLNLARRQDRRLFMEFKLRDVSAVRPARWVATRGRSGNGRLSPGALGLLETYRRLLAHLADDPAPVLLFEDDVYFHRDFDRLFQEVPGLAARFDVVYLGANIHRGRVYGTFGVALSKRARDRLARALEGSSQVAVDNALAALVPPLSRFIAQPYLVIPEVRDSDTSGARDMLEFARTRGYDLAQYRHVGLYPEFLRAYDLVYSQKRADPRRLPGVPRALVEGADPVYLLLVVSSHNNALFVDRNLQSLFGQDYPLWRMVYVDDASTDGTPALVAEAVRRAGLQDKVRLVQNRERRFAAFSRHAAYRDCGDDEVVVMVDGDDWLPHPGVLGRVAEAYRSGELLAGYGQFRTFDGKALSARVFGAREFPPAVVRARAFRSFAWISQHLRTFRGSLIRRIPPRFLQDQEGRWARVCTDMAESFWCLENARGRHRNLGEVAYVYNKHRPLGYGRNGAVSEEERRRAERWFRSMKPEAG